MSRSEAGGRAGLSDSTSAWSTQASVVSTPSASGHRSYKEAPMPMNLLPWFPFYGDDFFADPCVRLMSLAARGAFITLLWRLWRSTTPGVVANDDILLARLADATPEEWSEIGGQVRTAFSRDSRTGNLVQKRMVAEYHRQVSYHNLRSKLGKIGRTMQLAGRAGAEPGLDPGNSDSDSDSEVKRSKKDSDSVPISGSGDGPSIPAAPVPVAARIALESVLKPATPHPDAQAQIEAMRKAGLLPALRMLPNTSEERR